MNRPREWYRMPSILLTRDTLSKTAIHVMAIMIDRQDKNYKVTISISDLQELTGRSRRAITYALKELREEGWITDAQRTGRASEYTLLNIIGQKIRY